METKSVSIYDLKKTISEKQASPESILFGIFLKESKQHIGNIKLEPIEFNRREAVIGIIIGKKQEWGKGFCPEAVIAVVDYAFSIMNLNKIRLGVISENTAAINCYKKAGFIIEKTGQYTGVNTDSYREAVYMSMYNPKIKTVISNEIKQGSKSLE
jgi:RimJ/RimL family protein N-acetyltransferase